MRTNLFFAVPVLVLAAACVEATTAEASCGNGVAEAGEGCDDGNTASGDGCSATCGVEAAGVCGDGVRNVGEGCDDGNTTPGDGCSARCQEEGEVVCGDGEVEGAEACDDGNTTSGDGCSDTCTIEIVCGDGVVAGDEACDDGNDVDTDGCIECVVARCGDGHVQAGVELCDDGDRDGGDGCDAACHTEVCGNGVIQPALDENCDDGNRDPGDGCGPTCQLETCGDAVLQPATIESLTFTWLGTTCAAGGTITFELGGTDVLTAALDEGCDCDAPIESQTVTDPAILALLPNEASAAGVRVSAGSNLAWALVTVNAGDLVSDVVLFDPTGGTAARTRNPDVCFAQQPDVDVDLTVDPRLPEQCDDGNEDTTDACPACVPAFCGDGFVLAGTEPCDDGNDYSDDNCLPGCIPATCGDGLINVVGGENCEDGNTEANDGCGPDCRVEFCGDGILQGRPLVALDVLFVATSCGGGAFHLAVNGVEILNQPIPTSCTCDPGIGVVSITDPAVLALFAGDDTLALSPEGDALVAWVLVTGRSPGGDATDLVVYDAQGGTDAINRNPSLCNSGFENGPSASAQGSLTTVELCDDGNADTSDDCPACRAARCGDGFTLAGVEECDDGDADDLDGCTTACRLPVCGDGIWASTEFCDDGNVVDGDGCPADCQGPAPMLTEDFESGAPGWTHEVFHGGFPDTWQLTQDRAASGTTSYWSGGTTPAGSGMRLRSAPIDLTAVAGSAVLLEFWHSYDFDDCNQPGQFIADGASLEVNVNGAGFTPIDPIGGYPFSMPGACDNPLNGRGVFSDDTAGEFRRARIDLTPFVGSVVEVGFVVGFDCGNCSMPPGYYLDDVAVYAVP